MEGAPAQTISVIIPTKNEEDVIEECLMSIFNQSVNPLEVIIVDGCSTDHTLDIAKKFNVTIIKEGEFSSPANARNVGAENAKGDIILLMDADVLLEHDCLERASEVFMDDNVIAAVPSELGYNHSYLELIQRKWNEGLRTSVNIGLQRVTTSGLVAFFRKEVFEKIKFDTAFGFGEDDDFSTRLRKEFDGYKILTAEDCKVIAHSPHTIGELAARYVWWGRTFLAYLGKHINLKSFLNMGSLLLPTLVTFSFFSWLLVPPAGVLFGVLLFLFVLKILIVCIRSRSLLFFQFFFFDLTRSLFFFAGLVQSLFTTKKGR